MAVASLTAHCYPRLVITKHQKVAVAGALAGLFAGLLFSPRFGLAQVGLCVCTGICLGVSVYSLARGEFVFVWGRLPPKTLVGRQARMMALACLTLSIYVAYDLTISASHT